MWISNFYLGIDVDFTCHQARIQGGGCFLPPPSEDVLCLKKGRGKGRKEYGKWKGNREGEKKREKESREFSR